MGPIITLFVATAVTRTSTSLMSYGPVLIETIWSMAVVPCNVFVPGRAKDPGRTCIVCARIHEHPVPEHEYPARIVVSDLNLVRLGRPVRQGEQLLLWKWDPLHVPAKPVGDQIRGQILGVREYLGAEGPADRRLIYADRP